MSKIGRNDLHLTGTGAAYIRVSTDRQDTERQYAAVHAFESLHGVSISKRHWYEDEGWARDEADRRPDFQRLVQSATSGTVRWIVVDQLDRFGTKNGKQLISYLHRLDEAGCKLYDVGGKEWTGEDVGTIITAVIEGEKSKGEQTSKSHRVLGGKIEKARLGEWQGGPIRLGFDVVCYHRETNQELWRVAFEGCNKRLKIYADGRSERFDGPGNFPKFQPVTEVLRVSPSKDEAKVAAAVGIFNRYAMESISFTGLARSLNGLGWRNSYDGYFQNHHVESMLEDPIYLGYYTYNRRHFGKFHRFTDGRVVPELNYDEKQSKNNKADWVQSRRLFNPLVDQRTWDLVQRKLAHRSRRTNAPRSAMQYLAGLVYCGNCGHRMVAGAMRKTRSNSRKDGHIGDRYEYFCGSYFKAIREGRREECSCRRNGVFQDTLEAYIGRWLKETGQRLELLTEGFDEGDLINRLEDQETEHWQEFSLGMERLRIYLSKFHREQYNAIVADSHAEDATLFEFVEACVNCYSANFDPSIIETELAKVRIEHDRLVDGWRDLPTQRAKDVAAERLAVLDTRLGELERKREDLGETVFAHFNEMNDLRQAIADAELAMQSTASERSLRQRAEALRAVVQRIECTFTATGKKGSGWGKKHSRLAKVTIYPVVGDSYEFPTGSKGTLLYSSAHSRM